MQSLLQHTKGCIHSLSRGVPSELGLIGTATASSRLPQRNNHRRLFVSPECRVGTPGEPCHASCRNFVPSTNAATAQLVRRAHRRWHREPEFLLHLSIRVVYAVDSLPIRTAFTFVHAYCPGAKDIHACVTTAVGEDASHDLIPSSRHGANARIGVCIGD